MDRVLLTVALQHRGLISRRLNGLSNQFAAGLFQADTQPDGGRPRRENGRDDQERGEHE